MSLHIFFDLFQKIAGPIRARHDTVLAAHALLAIHDYNTVFPAFGCPCRALLLTFRFSAMHAGDGKESQFAVGVLSHLEFEDTVEENPL
jgi:hypothetical protein